MVTEIRQFWIFRSQCFFMLHLAENFLTRETKLAGSFFFFPPKKKKVGQENFIGNSFPSPTTSFSIPPGREKKKKKRKEEPHHPPLNFQRFKIFFSLSSLSLPPPHPPSLHPRGQVVGEKTFLLNPRKNLSFQESVF